VSLVLRHLVLESKSVPAGATEVEFLVEPDAGTRLLAEARVRVVDAKSGAPLHPAYVELGPCDIGGGGVQTDEDGVAVFKDLLPGPLELSVGGEQHAWFQPGVEIEPAKMNDLGTLRIPGSCRLAGRVVDEEGAPVSVVVTWLYAESTDRPDRIRIHESTRSDSEGRFEFESVLRGKLLLWSLPDGDDQAIACVTIDTSSGDRNDAVLRVERGRVIGLRFEPAEFESAAWILRRSDGVAVRARDGMDRSPVPLRLPDGAYRVEVWRNGAAVGAQEFRVPGDGDLIHVRL
jgi:protocatechuate 3,4-dioxygenase beta subunit